MADAGDKRRPIVRQIGHVLVADLLLLAQLQDVLDGDGQQAGTDSRGISQEIGPEDGAEGGRHGEASAGPCGGR